MAGVAADRRETRRATPGAVAADRRWIGRAALGAVVVFGYAIIVTPLGFVSWLAFFRNEVVSFPPEGYTLRWFGNILDQNNFVDGFLTSLQVGLVAMAAGLAIGVPASVAIARRRFRGPRPPRSGSASPPRSSSA